MGIKINIHPALQHFANDLGVVEVDDSTVGQCLDQLIRQFPAIGSEGFYKNGKLNQFIDVYLNRERVDPNDLATPTKDGDEIHIVILIGGG